MPAAIGPYRVVGLLGEGGMGVVWEAEQQHPSRRVAVKVMREAHHFSDLQARMFEREVETLGRLKHTNIAAIYESGWTEGGHGWFAMELVRGETLDRWLATRPDPFARDEMVLRLRLFQTVCAAVNYAHQRGVIHRDLKPTNIAVLADAAGAAESAGASPHRDLAPPVKVLDFSLARFADAGEDAGSLLTRAGVVRGTPQYMSPEQARGETTTLDVRTDVYPLGMILYELLARARPYSLSGLTMVEAVRVICETPPRPLREVWRGARRLDPDLETIVGKALEKEPDRRYPSAAALSDDVERYLNAEPIAARPPSRVYRARKFLARHRLGVAVAAAAVVLLAGFGASMAVQARRVARERDRANLEAQAFKRVAGFMAGMFR
ncbi:MAG TPA: serine/threonine-protein kinase, partial [Dongiaceae bacterium]|nr:serine/threonine-protein kinase [Dongiaceae bacterium]